MVANNLLQFHSCLTRRKTQNCRLVRLDGAHAYDDITCAGRNSVKLFKQLGGRLPQVAVQQFGASACDGTSVSIWVGWPLMLKSRVISCSISSIQTASVADIVPDPFGRYETPPVALAIG